MANFIFNWALAALQAATLDLSTGNYYAHLVTTAPAVGHSTVADLVLPTVSGYASTPLTGLNYNSTRWTFDSFTFPKYTFVSAPTGVVICKRSSASPATTDGIVCYSDFNNSIGQNIILSVGAYAVNLQFGSNGAINFTYRYQYTSGAYANIEAVPKGLIFLIGSKNNTVAYNNPFSNATSFYSPNGGTFGANFFTDRNNSIVDACSNYAFDFGIYPTKVSIFGFNIPGAISKTIELWASNILTGLSTSNINTDNDWTLLGSISNPVAGWNFLTCSNNDYWQYLKLKTSDNSFSLLLTEIELYNSSAISPTPNFV